MSVARSAPTAGGAGPPSAPRRRPPCPPPPMSPGASARLPQAAADPGVYGSNGRTPESGEWPPDGGLCHRGPVRSRECQVDFWGQEASVARVVPEVGGSGRQAGR